MSIKDTHRPQIYIFSHRKSIEGQQKYFTYKKNTSKRKSTKENLITIVNSTDDVEEFWNLGRPQIRSSFQRKLVKGLLFVEGQKEVFNKYKTPSLDPLLMKDLKNVCYVQRTIKRKKEIFFRTFMKKKKSLLSTEDLYERHFIQRSPLKMT